MPETIKKDVAAALRAQAEAQVPPLCATGGPPVPAVTHDHLVHELQVHQIELEIQNEELRRTLLELEVSRERYFDLYDLAPVGYLSISEKGLILQSNLTVAALLGEPRGLLVGQALSRFVLPEDLGTYFHHKKLLLATGEAQAFDLQMLTKGGVVSWVRLETALATTAVDGSNVVRAALSNINKSKRVEKELQEKAARLETAMGKLESLAGLLPICGRCRKIRDEQGKWRLIGDYIAEHSDIAFLHPVCPDCQSG